MPLYKQLITSMSELIETRLISSTVSDRMTVDKSPFEIDILQNSIAFAKEINYFRILFAC